MMPSSRFGFGILRTGPAAGAESAHSFQGRWMGYIAQRILEGGWMGYIHVYSYSYIYMNYIYIQYM